MIEPAKTKTTFPYYDGEERDEIEAYLKDKGEADRPLEERVRVLQQLAANTNKKKLVTLRLFEKDISSLKVIAMEEGRPYQTLLASIVRKFVQSRGIG